jgi:hypothetical protein
MKKKPFQRKLKFNKTTIATLNSNEQSFVYAGKIFPVIRTDDCFYSEGCVYTETCMCTSPGCDDSRYAANGCIGTNYGDMLGCPETMTLCGELYCP